MGKIFGDLTYAETRPRYVGAPVEEMKALQQSASDKYNENSANADKLDIAINNLDVRSVDFDKKKAALEKLKGTLRDTTEAGNWETAHLVVQRAAKDVASDDLLQGALKSRQMEAAYNEKINKNDKLTAQDKAAALALAQDQNRKGVYRDKNGQVVGHFSDYLAPSESVDVDAKMNEFVKSAKSNESPIGVIRNPKTGEVILQRDANGEYLITGTTEYVKKDKLDEVLHQYAMNSPEIRDYLRFEKDAHDLNTFGSRTAPRTIYPEDLQSLGLDQDTIDKMTTSTGTTMVGGEYKSAKVYDPNKAKQLYDAAWLQKRIKGYVDPVSLLNSFSKTKYDIKTDEYKLAEAKNALEKQKDLQPNFTTPISVPGLNSDIKSPADFKTKQEGVKQANQSEVDRATQYINNNNLGKHYIDLLRLAANGDKSITPDMFHGVYSKDGVSHLEPLKKFLLQIQQNNKTNDDIKDYELKVKKQAGLISGDGNEYKPSPEMETKVNARMATQFYAESNLPGFNPDMSGKTTLKTNVNNALNFIKSTNFSDADKAEWTQRIKTAYGKVLDKQADFYAQEGDPKYATYAKLLSENATKNVETIGLTNFSDKKVEDVLAKNISVDLNENGLQGAKWLGGKNAGNDLEADDYTKISKAEPNSIRFGMKDGKVILAFRPIVKGSDKNEAEQMDYVQVEAPQGVIPALIKDKQVQYADVMIGQELDKISASPNHLGNIDDIKITAPFHSDATQSPGGQGTYTVVVPTREAPNGKVFTLNSTDEVTNLVKNYLNKKYGN